MRQVKKALILMIISLAPSAILAQPEYIEGKPTQLTEGQWNRISKHLNEKKAEIKEPTGAKEILSVFKKVEENKNFAVIMHVVRWEKTEDRPIMSAQNWYAYQQGVKKVWLMEDFAERKRLYGVDKVIVLYLHLNYPTVPIDYEAAYKISVKKKVPAYINHLLDVLSLSASDSRDPETAPPNHFYGIKEIALKYRVSDIVIEPYIKNPDNTITMLGERVTFDNEGLYYFDFSIGLPVRRIRELEFNLTANTVTPREVDKQTAFALLNLYPRPIDIKTANFSYIPHFVGGVALAKQPLHRILVGAGWGPAFANFYAGALFVKQPVAPAAEQTTLPTNFKYKTQFAFGVNLPVGAVIEKLNKKE